MATRTRTCPHPEGGWGVTHGIATCRACGVRRFVDYGALRLPGQAVATGERVFATGPSAAVPGWHDGATTTEVRM
ncbi:DUF6255 family natural product biosynthesis protein [Streptomyces sp. C36]|uniref:DUF6255 family natural product biosynthesis protein n=1 Tax=Streptomyces sp. C36 TaxID=3237122 RepID=UPI0034C605B2